jgi:hypothetical protein
MNFKPVHCQAHSFIECSSILILCNSCAAVAATSSLVPHGFSNSQKALLADQLQARIAQP